MNFCLKKIIVFFYLILFSIPHFAQTDYTWDNVRIGGGGYITGVVVHPANPDIIYVRCDVGGCYRWLPEQKRLKQLMNWVSAEKSNLYGIFGLALDPADTNVVYVAAGKYPDRSPHDVLKSTDRGENWAFMGLNKTFGGNRHPNRKSNPLAVNPHKTYEIWAGTLGQGLFVFNDTLWKKVESVPSGESIRTVIFDPNDSTIVYVSVRGNGVFRSKDAGKSFTEMGNAPIDILDMSLSKEGTKLYISTTGHGIHRVVNPVVNDTWEDVSPANELYRTITASPHDDNIVMTFKGEYSSISYFYVSENGGETWSRKSDYILEKHIPWHPDSYAGSAVSQIAFDPVDPKRIYFTDWYSFWKTDDWTANTITWTNEMGIGHEEVVTSIVKESNPRNPAGIDLYSGHADVSGFSHQSASEVPVVNLRTLAGSDLAQEISGFSYCENFPKYVAVMGGKGWDMTTGGVYISDDCGKSLKRAIGYNASWGGGRVVMSAVTPMSIIAATKNNGLVYSLDGGSTFKKSSIPLGSSALGSNGQIFSYKHQVCADFVNHSYYAYDRINGNFYRSDDFGANFSRIFSDLPSSSADKIFLASVPAKEGHLWLSLANSGLWRSEDGGTSWTKLSGIKDAMMMAVGVSKINTGYPAIYFLGKLTTDDEYWFYQSIDKGLTWTRVNNEKYRIGNSPQAFAADRKYFGRVYTGTNGSGVWYSKIDDIIKPVYPETINVKELSEGAILNWSKGSDNVQVTGYNIYVNDAFHAFTPDTTHLITGLLPSTVYQLQVKTVDASDNISESGQSIHFNTLSGDITNPAPPSDLAIELHQTHIKLSWQKGTDDEAVLGYKLSVNGDESLITADTSAYLIGLSHGEEYEIGCQSVDVSGNLSELVTTSVSLTEKKNEIDRESDRMKVFPNPASGFIHVYIPMNQQAGKLEIISRDGRIVAFLMIDKNVNKTRMNVDDIPAGFYFLKLSNDSGNEIKPLILN